MTNIPHPPTKELAAAKPFDGITQLMMAITSAYVELVLELSERKAVDPQNVVSRLSNLSEAMKSQQHDIAAGLLEAINKSISTASGDSNG